MQGFETVGETETKGASLFGAFSSRHAQLHSSWSAAKNGIHTRVWLVECRCYFIWNVGGPAPLSSQHASGNAIQGNQHACTNPNCFVLKSSTLLSRIHLFTDCLFNTKFPHVFCSRLIECIRGSFYQLLLHVDINRKSKVSKERIRKQQIVL